MLTMYKLGFKLLYSNSIKLISWLFFLKDLIKLKLIDSKNISLKKLLMNTIGSQTLSSFYSKIKI